MKYLKTTIKIPIELYKRISDKNISEEVENIARSYINKDIEVKSKGKSILKIVSLSYDFIKEIHQKRNEKAKDFIEKALQKWGEENGKY